MIKVFSSLVFELINDKLPNIDVSNLLKFTIPNYSKYYKI
jgi:hypothetical protein